MTIDEAIKILHRHFLLHHNVPLAELNEAAELGIEALKRCKLLRAMASFQSQDLLLGETKE